jgi:tRNA threonylcarbamoyladenosine biosynthesis protein TsaE
MKEYKVKTNSLEETHQLGEILGRNAMANMVFLLDGDLGAGKTTLTQGIAKGLDIHKNVTSPTFTIQKSITEDCRCIILMHIGWKA